VHPHPGMLVVLESTTYPGTTEEVVRSILQETGLRAGIHYPVSTYLGSVARIISNDGVLLVDIRKGTDGLAELKR
jgi:hypothetical protein